MKTKHPQEQSSTDALFRYQVVSQVLTRQQMGELCPDAICSVSKSSHVTVDGQQRTVSKRTIYRWLATFKDKGFDGLLPKPRKTGISSVLPEKLTDFLQEQKEDDPRASIPELIRRAKQLNIVAADVNIDRTTVWRSLQHMGVNTKRRKYPKKMRDSRRFAYPHRMDMVLCDGKHFRAGSSRLKRVALFFIDDATRMVLGATVGTAESSKLFLQGLYQVIKNYGLMTAVYIDHGPGFIAHDTIDVLKNLDVLCIHGAKAYPMGHGKVERFNQTAQEQVLRHLDKNPEVDPACTALDLRLGHYLANQYIQTPHESLERETPWHRFHNDTKGLRFVENQHHLNEHFILHQKRRVSNDNVVSLNSIQYEMLRGHAGSKVTIRRNVLDGSLSFLEQGRLIKLAPVDLHANARDSRANRGYVEKEPFQPMKHTKSSAGISFNKDIKPIVGADGGFTRINKKEEKDEY